MIVLLLLTELILLYILSRRLIQGIYRLLYIIIRSRTASIWIVTIIFFPGTVVHELAHLFVAEILGVHTGKLTLVPEGIEGPPFAKASGGETEIKAGGVMISETDPFRRTLIGLAPVYVGIAVLATLAYFLQQFNSITLLTIGIFYIMFAVSNSMFSSKEDMKGVIPFAITVALFTGAAYIAGIRVGLTGELLAGMNRVVETLVRSLGVVIGVNVVALFAVSGLLAIVKR